MFCIPSTLKDSLPFLHSEREMFITIKKKYKKIKKGVQTNTLDDKREDAGRKHLKTSSHSKNALQKKKT